MVVLFSNEIGSSCLLSGLPPDAQLTVAGPSVEVGEGKAWLVYGLLHPLPSSTRQELTSFVALV